MADGERISAAHPTVETLRARVERHGGRRHRLVLPAAPSVPEPGTTVRVIFDDGTRFAPITAGRSADERWITAVYRSLAGANAGDDSANVLSEWLGAADRSPGRTVLVDVLVPEYAFGFRIPGEQRTYPIIDPPDEGLADIAQDLDS